MKFESKYQDGKDGPLVKSVRARINKFREDGSTLAEIGKALGFSGAFTSQILNEDSPARVRSIHVPRIIKALEEAEAERDNNSGSTEDDATERPSASSYSLEELIRAIDAKGFDVTVTPKAR